MLSFLNNLNGTVFVLRPQRIVNVQVENTAWVCRGPTTQENQCQNLDKSIKMKIILDEVFL